MKRLKTENPNTQEYWDKESVEKGWLEKNWEYSPGDKAWEVMKHIDYGNSVLDVGFGSGMVLRRIKEIRPNLYISGCDFSKEAIKFLSARLPINEYFWCNANKEIPKPDKSFDIVVSTEVIEHMDSPEHFIKELARVARNKIIITTPYGDKSCDSGEHMWAFWLDDLYNLMKPYGMVYLTVASGGSNIVAVCQLS